MKYLLWSAGITFSVSLVLVSYVRLSTESVLQELDTHQASYPLKDFYPSLGKDDYVDQIPDQIYGGVVSHHLLADKDIADFFAEFRSQSVQTVVLIGPNHFSIGDSDIAISRQGFETPWGVIEPETQVIDSLLARKLVAREEAPFKVEHSIAALVPYIKYNFPDARLVPILFQRTVTRAQLDDIAVALTEVLSDDAVVIASVDFSHHLNEIGTNFHDVASISAIKNFDFNRIFNLEIDSPPSIYTLLKYLDAKGARKVELRSRNSADYTGNAASEDMTSYVFAHFTMGESSTDTRAISLHFGDMMFSGQVAELIDGGGDPFEYIQGVEGNFLRGVDVTMGNLEGVVAGEMSCREDKEIIMKFSTSVPTLLKKYNFNGVTLANNHSRDCFASGLEGTMNALAQKGIFAVDAEGVRFSHVSKKIGSLNVAFIGLNELGLHENDFEEVYDQIHSIRETHDSVVVHIHWGYEYDEVPSDIQVRIAHNLIDAGVDVVIGHHPHVTQTIEKYKNKMIFYSLGNFISDQPMPETKIGFGVGLIHDNEGSVSGSIFPYQIEKAMPKLMPYDIMAEYCQDKLGGNEVTTCSF